MYQRRRSEGLCDVNPFDFTDSAYISACFSMPIYQRLQGHWSGSGACSLMGAQNGRDLLTWACYSSAKGCLNYSLSPSLTQYSGRDLPQGPRVRSHSLMLLKKNNKKKHQNPHRAQHQLSHHSPDHMQAWGETVSVSVCVIEMCWCIKERDAADSFSCNKKGGKKKCPDRILVNVNVSTQTRTRPSPLLFICDGSSVLGRLCSCPWSDFQISSSLFFCVPLAVLLSAFSLHSDLLAGS